MINLIRYQVRTAKSTRMLAENKYLFSVDVRLTKPQIKKICEKLFDVQIRSVHTHINPLKKRRLGMTQGYKTHYKRAIITLKRGQKMNPVLFPKSLEYETKNEDSKQD